jgi:hypothetical protein
LHTDFKYNKNGPTKAKNSNTTVASFVKSPGFYRKQTGERCRLYRSYHIDIRKDAVVVLIVNEGNSTERSLAFGKFSVSNRNMPILPYNCHDIQATSLYQGSLGNPRPETIPFSSKLTRL